MAPIRVTRAGAGDGVSKKVTRKRPTRKEPSTSWELLDRQGMKQDTPDDDEDEVMDGVDENHAIDIDNPTDVDDAVNPLREMAERVGKEVETFAETLDRFLNEELPTASSRFEAAYDLVLEFQTIAEETVKEMKKTHEKEMRDQLKQEWSEDSRVPAASTAFRPFTSAGTSLGPRKAEQVRQLRQWQQEADIWDLFKMMLELHPFADDKRKEQEEKAHILAQRGEPHRYTEEGTLWERFLMQDDVANERYKIKMWLERTADHQSSDIQGIMEELETKAGKGKGLWSSGWMNTREQIKKEKRLRTWPTAADAPLPQIRRSDNNEMLATQLDPDAPARQQRTLEKPDAYFERAVWIALWEMLRRGAGWQDICDWCEERKEGWRAVSLGRLFDNTEPEASSSTWRHVCQMASQSASSSEYEAAVYGLLGGNVQAVEKVCRTVDDHLYAYYSAVLLRQFDQYLVSVCPDKATPQPWRRSAVDTSLHDPEQATEAIMKLILRLREGSTTKQESALPMKIIQSYLLADEAGSLIHSVGTAIAETASMHGEEDMIFLGNRRLAQNGRLSPEAEVALNPQTLRIATHMSIVLRALSPDYLEGDELMEDENVLVAYIQALRAAGKRDLIPLYASRLQHGRYVVVLGRVLQDIADTDEQGRVLKLLQEYDMDVVSILTEQLRWVMDHTFTREFTPQPLRILEDTEETKLHPGQRIIVDFLPDEVTPADETLVRCLQWYQMSAGSWKITFEALSLSLRRCLVAGRFAAARMIVQQFPYSTVSASKSHSLLGRSLNLMETTAEPYDDNERLAWNIMRRQSRTYYELEQLVHAVEALSTWRVEEDKYVSKASKPSTVPSVLKRAKEHVSAQMTPLLKGILRHPEDEQEEEEMEFIRNAYLPEIVIAYNTVLHAAGNLITRDCLLESMELSVMIAKDKPASTARSNNAEEGNGLAECFVQAGRMRELVASFALTGKVMLVLKAEGKPWRKRKGDRVGRDLGVWEIGSVGARGE